MGEELHRVCLKCVSCGADLDITPDMETFACAYCGTRQIVRREGGAVWLKEIGDAIARVQVGTDRTAAELAVRRLQDELAKIAQQQAALSDVEVPFTMKSAWPFWIFGLGIMLGPCAHYEGDTRTGCVFIVIGIAALIWGCVARSMEMSVVEEDVQNQASIIEDQARIIQEKMDIELQKLES